MEVLQKKSPKRLLLQFFGIFLKYWNLDKFPGSSRSDAMQCSISLASGGEGGKGRGRAMGGVKPPKRVCIPEGQGYHVVASVTVLMGHISKP